MEGEAGQHATSPVELEHLTWSSEGKLLSNHTQSVGSDLNGLTTPQCSEDMVYPDVSLGQPF